MIDIEKAEKEMRKAEDAARHKEHYVRPAECFLEEANEPFQCWKVLHELNKAIECMYMLSDNYYRDYIWNAGGETSDQLKRNGLDDDNYYLGIAAKLETLRAILFGHNADWRKIESEMYDKLLIYEASQHRNYERMFDDVLRQRDKLQDKLEKLEGEKK